MHGGKPGHYCKICQTDYSRYGRPARPASRRATACVRCEGEITGRGRVRLCEACSVDWKWCNKCSTVKAKSAFRLPNGRPYGYCYECMLAESRERYASGPEQRQYHYRHHLRRKYGISAEHADRLASTTECEVCGVEGTTSRGLKGKGQQLLHVDHDHGTNGVRGVLCVRCNHIVGALEADPARLEQLRAYLARYA